MFIDDSYSAGEPIRGSGILMVMAQGLPEAQSGQASPWQTLGDASTIRHLWRRMGSQASAMAEREVLKCAC